MAFKFLHVLYFLINSLISIFDSINTWKYIISAKFYSILLEVLIISSAIIYPFSLFIYQGSKLTLIHYLQHEDFKNFIIEKNFNEMIYFRPLIKKYKVLIIPLSLFLSTCSYVQIYSFYSLKYLMETRVNYEIFYNVMTTTLYNPIFIQIITQTLPQLIFRTSNNLLIMNQNENFIFERIINFSSIISIILITNLIFLCFRDKKKYINANKESNICEFIFYDKENSLYDMNLENFKNENINETGYSYSNGRKIDVIIENSY